MEIYEMDEFVKSMINYSISDILALFIRVLLIGVGISVLIGFLGWGINSACMTFKNIINK